MDRLYDTTRTGQLLGGLHANDVRELIRQGRLRAKSIVVRGKSRRPRQYVTASEIARFIAELPSPEEVRRAGGIEPSARQRLLAPHKRELQRVKEYY
jgi:hypothetical protein